MSEATQTEQPPVLRQTIFYDKDNAQKVCEQIAQKFNDQSVLLRADDFTPSIEIDPAQVSGIFAYLHDHLGYTFLDSISGVDFLEFKGAEKDRSTVPWSSIYPQPQEQAQEDGSTQTIEPRLFMLVYHLFNFEQKKGLVIKTVPAQTDIDTIDQIYGNANWLEREIFDLFGIEFTGSRDMRRLMMPEDWQGAPLRRDYEQPSHYAGMSTDRPDPIAHLRQYQEQKNQASQ